MNEMVERVARAFSDVCLDGCEHQGKADEMRACVDPPCYCRELARVAITAMREPTEAQAKLMDDLLARADRPATKRWHWVWQEMIDSALRD